MSNTSLSEAVARLQHVYKGTCFYKAIGYDIIFAVIEEKSPGLIIWKETKLGINLADRVETILDKRKREEEQRKLRSQKKAG